MTFSRLCAFLLVASGFCFSGVAAADEGRAAVLPFRGPQSARVRQNVQKGLRAADVEVISLRRVDAVVRKTQGYAKQATRLEATVLVGGRVRRAEGRWILDAGVRNDRGQRVDKVRATSSSLTRASNRLVAQLLGTGRMPTEPAADTAPSAERPRAPTQPRMVVRPFEGTQAARVRGAVVRGLRSEPIELYPNARFVAEAERLGTNLESAGGHVAPAAALSVSGLFEGDVQRDYGVWSAYVRLVDGRSAKVVSQHYYEGGSLSALMRTIVSQVGDDFGKDMRRLGVRAPTEVSVAPVAPAPAPIAEEAATEQVEVPIDAPRAAKQQRPAAVDIEADFRIVRRTLRYNDVVSTDLRQYTLGAGPGVALKFQYFPGAHFTSGVGAQFGIDFEWERLIGIDSTRADGQSFPTDSQQFLVALRWRYPKGRWEPFVVLGYGFHNFQFGVSGPPVPGEDNTAGVPGVRYRFVRWGAGFRVALGKKETFIVGGNIALRFVRDRVGGIGSNVWFPEAKANGLDTGLVFGFALPLGFEVRLGIDYRRYWFDLNPQPPTPPYIAGGALDRYVGGTVGFAWRR